MDDYQDKTEREEQPKARKRGFRRFLIFFLILAAVLGVVVVAAYRDGTGFDTLRRFFSYGSAEKAGGSTEFTYDASSSNRYAVFGNCMAVLSDTSLEVLNDKGEKVWSTSVKMNAPALAVGGDCAVAYDVGGTELYVVDGSGKRLALTAEEEEPFIAATLNGQGWLAVTSGKKNYKGCVSVYDNKMNLAFAFNSSQRFVTDAWVTDDCRSLAAVTLGQENSVFVSNIVLYDLDATDPVGNYSVKDGLVLAIGELSSRLTTVSDTCLTFAGTDGGHAAVYDYSGGYLREYSLGGDGYAALLLDRYQSGSVGRLVTVGTDGKELASLDVNTEILSISAAGRYLAVLYADRLVIYNSKLQEYATLSGTDYAKAALMRDDGSALMISSDRASLYLP